MERGIEEISNLVSVYQNTKLKVWLQKVGLERYRSCNKHLMLFTKHGIDTKYPNKTSPLSIIPVPGT